MSCRDCYTNCGGNINSDRCVKYTGPDIEFLEIETGDTLSMFEAAIVSALETALDGTGITFVDLALCDNLETALGKDSPSLNNLMQSISDVICEFQASIDDIYVKIKPSVVAFNTLCLEGLDSTSTRDQILQSTINKLCQVNDAITVIADDYVTSSELCDRVAECLSSTNVLLQENSKMPKFVALPYHGPMNVFDSGGIGIPAAGYEKVYICNGQIVGTFATPDYRGRSPIGANSNTPGGALDSATDPALIANAGYGITQGGKKGEYAHTSTINEIPAHIHSTPASTFNLKIPGQRGGDNSDNNNLTAFAGGDKLASDTGFNFTLNVPVNIPAGSTGSAGGGQPHNTTHPVIGSIFIIYIP